MDPIGVYRRLIEDYGKRPGREKVIPRCRYEFVINTSFLSQGLKPLLVEMDGVTQRRIYEEKDSCFSPRTLVATFYSESPNVENAPESTLKGKCIEIDVKREGYLDAIVRATKLISEQLEERVDVISDKRGRITLRENQNL